MLKLAVLYILICAILVKIAADETEKAYWEEHNDNTHQ